MSEPVSEDEESPELLGVELAPGVAIEFDEPRHAGLTWERDREHQPVALAPLASDYARLTGNSLNSWHSLRGGGFPQRWLVAIWHGYVYYTFETNSTPEEWAEIERRMTELWRERADVTEAYWDNDILPELRSIYGRMDAIEGARTSGAELSALWREAWRDTERVWQLHMDLLSAPFETLDALEQIYQVAAQSAPPGEVYRLIQGQDHELFQMELATERLVGLALADPVVADALRSGTRSFGDLR